MSVVATKVTEKEIIIASDSIRVFGWTQDKIPGDSKAAKLYKTKNGVVVGGVGLAEHTGMLKLFLDTHLPKSMTEDALLEFFSEFQDWVRKKTGNSGYDFNTNDFHLVWDGRAFHVSNYYIREITDFHTIGAGMDFALAALYLGRSVEQAVEAACELSVYCEEPINVIRIPKEHHD